MSSLFNEIYQKVCDIPEGYVATYGQIARSLKNPCGARQVGYALAALHNDQDVPWHRVVNARGEISARTKSGYEDFQRILLEDEGIVFNLEGRIDLTKFLWEGMR